MTKPVLSYQIRTAPTPVQITKDATISLVVSNPTSDYVSLSKIEFQLPGSGTAATDLSNNQVNIPTASRGGGWTITQSGSIFTITPNNSAAGTVKPNRIGGDGLVFTFGPIPINQQPGTAMVTVAEDTGDGLSSKLDFNISKWPVEFNLSNFKATHSSVPKGKPAVLSWNLSGNATLTLEYNGLNVSNPSNPYTSQDLSLMTVFTLTAKSSINGNPVEVSLQTIVEIEEPSLVSVGDQFDIVYMGQGNALYWSTMQSDNCVLKANGVIIDPSAPANTVASGYPIAASQLKSTTTFELEPVKGSVRGASKQWSTFAKQLFLRRSFSGMVGWGAVTVDRTGKNAYVCNSSARTLEIVPLATGMSTMSIPVGLGARGVSLGDDDTVAVVSNAFDDSISIIDLTSHKITSTISGIKSPAGSAILGNTAFIASPQKSDSKIMTVNIETGELSELFAVKGQPFDVAVTPDGRTIYVANYSSTSIDVYDVDSASMTHSIDVKTPPTTVAVSGNGASVYAGTQTGTDIYVLNSHSSPPDVTAVVSALSRPANIGVSGSGQFMVTIGPSGFFVFELSVPDLPNAEVSSK